MTLNDEHGISCEAAEMIKGFLILLSWKKIKGIGVNLTSSSLRGKRASLAQTYFTHTGTNVFKK